MRIPALLVVGAALLAGGCTYPDGRVDYAGTALLGAGVGAAAGLAAGAVADQPRYGYGYGYNAGYAPPPVYYAPRPRPYYRPYAYAPRPYARPYAYGPRPYYRGW